MSYVRKLAAGAAVCVFAATFGATAAYAQQTTAAIRGVTVGDDGKPVSGVTVTVTHVPTGAKLTAVTGADGIFDLRGLKPGGPYSVVGKAGNGVVQTVDNVYLTVASQEQVILTMTGGTAVAEVVVSGTRKSRTLVANVGSRTTLRADAIEAVVSPKRDLRDVARRDPLANLDLVTRGTGPTGGLYIAGSVPRSNRITIDGVRSQDDFGLNTGGLSTNRGPISLEALEQVSVQDAPFDVEEGDFTGGALNLITKSGTNDFHGTAFGFTRTGRDVGTQLPFSTVTVEPALLGVAPNQTVNPTGGSLHGPADGTRKVINLVHEANYGLFMSGPLWKDKLFFAGSYEKYQSFDLTGAGPVGGGFGTNFSPIPGISTGAGATAADIATALSGFGSYAASSKLNPGVVSLTFPIVDEKYSTRVDYNIMDGQRLSFNYRHAFSSVEKGRASSSTGIFLDTNTYSQPETEDNYSLQLNSRWTPELSTEARVSYREYSRGQTPPEGQTFSSFGICTDAKNLGATFSCTSGVPTITFGPDQFRQANVLNTRDLAGQFVGNYRLGSHLIKAGYQYRGIHIYDLFVQAAHGVYYFDSVDDFNMGLANQLTYGNAFSGNPADAAAELEYQVHTLFAQDTWEVMPGLTVNGGLRYDFYRSHSVPLLNTNFVARNGFSNQQTYDGLSVLMPRFSAKWNTDQFELSGGVGRVSGGIPDVFLTNSFGANTGAATNAISVRRLADGTFQDQNTSAVVDPVIGAELLNLNKADAGLASQPAAVAQTLLSLNSVARRTAYTNSLAPGFKTPADWKFNLSFKTEKFGLGWQFDTVYTQSDTSLAFRDIRSRLLTQNGVQLLTPDGRLRYDGLNITAANRTTLGLPVATNTDLTNLGVNGDIQAYNPGKQNHVITAAWTVSKQWHGIDGSLTYVVQQGHGLVGISEFGTTAGGNGTTGSYYTDQTFSHDPNGAASGRTNNEIEDAVKLNLSYKVELFKGFKSRFTLFGENHSGRPINFLFTDPAGGRNPTFGTSRDDALLYVPNLGAPDPANPLKFTSASGTTVFFANAAALTSFKQLVQRFNIPQGGIVPRGVGENPRVNRFDFQYEQEIPTPLTGNRLVFTLDIANIGNLINHKWGVVKEYGGSRNGIPIVNAQCADSAGSIAGKTSAVCASYFYSYNTVNAANAAQPTIDTNSLYSVVFGLKYKF